MPFRIYCDKAAGIITVRIVHVGLRRPHDLKSVGNLKQKFFFLWSCYGFQSTIKFFSLFLYFCVVDFCVGRDGDSEYIRLSDRISSNITKINSNGKV